MCSSYASHVPGTRPDRSDRRYVRRTACTLTAMFDTAGAREGPASTASHLACCGIRKPTETPGFVPVTPPLVSWLQWESMKYPLTTMTPGPADTNGESVDQLNVAR